MSRNRKKTNRLPSFVALTWELLNSKAYIDLTHAAKGALPYFLGKIKSHGLDRFDSNFSFSYSEAKRFGFARATFHRIICELIEKGLIDPVDRGGLRGAGGSYSYFKLSERWRRYGENDFVESCWRTFLPKIR